MNSGIAKKPQTTHNKYKISGWFFHFILYSYSLKFLNHLWSHSSKSQFLPHITLCLSSSGSVDGVKSSLSAPKNPWSIFSAISWIRTMKYLKWEKKVYVYLCKINLNITRLPTQVKPCCAMPHIKIYNPQYQLSIYS